ncbi:MAG: PEGA domain-containing protein [Spirochaetales bacterium]|nr:PEGA domain-containing protein [Spirochaetales bacterium]
MKKIFFLLFTLPFLLNSQEININKDKWVIEWGKFSSESLSSSNQILSTTIPQYLMENIDFSHKHYLDSTENKLVLQELIHSKKKELTKERLDITKSRDLLLFEGYTQEKLKKIDERFKLNEEKFLKLETINELNLDGIDISYFPKDVNDLKYKDPFSVNSYMKKKSIDYYITGVLEEEYENIFLTIYLYSKYNYNPIKIWSGVGSSEDILNYREDILDSLYPYIVSKDVIPYTISVEEKDALIYINNEFKSLGIYSGYYVKKNPLNIMISKEGFETLKFKKVFTRYNNDLKVKLVESNSSTIDIETNPSGAKVYYGSLFMGETPLSIPLYSYAQKITLSLDGYREQSLVISSRSKSVNIDLEKGIIDSRQLFIEEKKNFYTSSAVFSFALAVPLFLNTQNLSDNENIEYIAIGNAVIWGINFFYRLYKYLDSAQISVE